MFFELSAVSKRYRADTVLRGVSFRVERGDIVSIVGPSGAGKTTLLKLVAGLEEPSGGTIRFERTPSLGHPVILVFQDFILFPHMTVFENVAFGLRARRVRRREIRERVEDMLEFFGIQDKAGSFPGALSAGQQQRAAIARAMVVSPAVLLLDEPFAHLDKNLRLETAAFIRSTQKKFGVTTVSVTHDLEEAFAMSDKIGILLDGRLEQFDTVEKVYFQPRTYQVARFLGPVNVIPRELFSTLGVNGDSTGCGEVYTRAEAMTVEPDRGGQGVVSDVRFAGRIILYRVELEGREFSVYSLNNGLSRGDRVSLRVNTRIGSGRAVRGSSRGHQEVNLCTGTGEHSRREGPAGWPGES